MGTFVSLSMAGLSVIEAILVFGFTSKILPFTRDPTCCQRGRSKSDATHDNIEHLFHTQWRLPVYTTFLASMYGRYHKYHTQWASFKFRTKALECSQSIRVAIVHKTGVLRATTSAHLAGGLYSQPFDSEVSQRSWWLCVVTPIGRE